MDGIGGISFFRQGQVGLRQNVTIYDLDFVGFLLSIRQYPTPIVVLSSMIFITNTTCLELCGNGGSVRVHNALMELLHVTGTPTMALDRRQCGHRRRNESLPFTLASG